MPFGTMLLLRGRRRPLPSRRRVGTDPRGEITDRDQVLHFFIGHDPTPPFDETIVPFLISFGSRLSPHVLPAMKVCFRFPPRCSMVAPAIKGAQPTQMLQPRSGG